MCAVKFAGEKKCVCVRMASDWDLVEELVNWLRSLREEEFLDLMYGEWFV